MRSATDSPFSSPCRAQAKLPLNSTIASTPPSSAPRSAVAGAEGGGSAVSCDTRMGAQDAPAPHAGQRANGPPGPRLAAAVLHSSGREQFMAASAPPSFVHLHVHSSFSLSEGAIKADKLAVLARDAGMPAVALTDTANLFGALEFSQACAAKGVQPIMGCQLRLGREHLEARGGAAGCDPERNAPDAVVALAMDAVGLDNLQRLSSLEFLNSDLSGRPCLRLDTLREHAAGLFLLTGGTLGPVSRLLSEGRREAAAELLAALRETFPDRLAVELHRHGLDAERAIEPALLDMADELGLPLVAANDVYFAKPEMHEAHDALLCIAEGRLLADPNRRRVTPEHWFTPPASTPPAPPTPPRAKPTRSASTTSSA